MTDRRLEAPLGEGDASLTIILTGKPCHVDDAAGMIAALLRDLRERLPKDAPCGCEDDAPQR